MSGTETLTQEALDGFCSEIEEIAKRAKQYNHPLAGLLYTLLIPLHQEEEMEEYIQFCFDFTVKSLRKGRVK